MPKNWGDGNVGGDQIFKGGLEILINLLVIYKLSKSVLKQKRHYVNKKDIMLTKTLVILCNCWFLTVVVLFLSCGS